MDKISAAPCGSEKTKVKVCAEPLPELGVTETAVGGELEVAVIVSEDVALWLNKPLVPVAVIVAVPVVAPEVVLIVNVVDPEPVTVAGLKPGVAPDGKPVAPKLTVPLKPLLPVTVTVYVV